MVVNEVERYVLEKVKIRNHLHLNRTPLAPKSSAAHGGRPCRPRGRPPFHPAAHKATHIHTHPPTILAHQPTKPPTATAQQPTEPRTSTHQATHSLPPCNATRRARRAAARRFAALQCHPTGAPPSRSALCRPAMPRFGAASSVGRERLVLVAALLPLAQSQRSRPPPSAASPLSCWRSPHRGY